MILVFGQSGQVAQELCRICPDAVFLNRADADLSDPEACQAAIKLHVPEAVINAAAYTAVDKAEDEKDEATTVNGLAPGLMAVACADRQTPFVHLSTDYVFDGSGDAAWTTGDPPAPLGAYGRSKLAGENAVRAANGPHAIVRTSWVFSAHGGNFVKTMLRLAETRAGLSIVDDQIGGPTPAGSLANACLRIARLLATDPSRAGTYHFAGYPDVSWKEYAETIFRLSGRQVSIEGIATPDVQSAAPRPLNSRLDCSQIKTVFGLDRPDWRSDLEQVLQELGEIPA